MREKALNYLGLMRKANAIELGETNTGAAVRSGKAKLLLIASDASDNAKSRAEGFLRGHSTIPVELPFTKEGISGHVGVSGCSMAAVTDIGFANAFVKALAAIEPESYELIAQEVTARFTKAERRRKETQAHERNKKIGKRRSNV